MAEQERQPSRFPRVKGRKRRPNSPPPKPRHTPAPHPDTVASATSRKRIWGVTDPFAFPPCEYHRSLLQTVEPLLTVHALGKLPDFDKFAGNAMQHETLIEAVGVLVDKYPSTSRLFSGVPELNIRPRHIALLQNLALLTRPSSLDQASLDRDMYTKSSPTVSSLPSAIEAQDDVAGLQIKGGGEKVIRKSVSSNEGLDVDNEAMAEGEDDRKAKGRSDFRAFVWDKAPLKRTELPDFIKDRLNLKRLAIVMESKKDEEADACSQAAGYARRGILRNIQNWHIQPVYLITLAATRWTYAILDVHGSIMIKDDTFADIDFENFKEQEKVRWANKDHGGISYTELKARLKFGLGNFRERYQAKPGASFPSQKFLVGDYYECAKWFPLPVIGMENGLCSGGSQRFYEGLLRVIVGERVLLWTPHDVRSARNIQLDLQDELNEIEGLDLSLELLEDMYDRAKKHLEKKRQRLGAVEDLE